MADINQTITLGIGTPASIPYFLTVGLGIGAAAAAIGKADNAVQVLYRDRRAAVVYRDRRVAVKYRDRRVGVDND